MEAVTGSGFFQEQAFCQLVTQYQLPLLRMCCIYLHDKSLAEDAVQETFLKAFKAISTFRGECSEKTWLMRIAINTCHDIKRSGWFRHRNRQVTLESLWASEAVSAAPEVELVAEIMKLPPKLQDVLLLYYYQNLSVYEIAEALGINHSSVSNRIKRAKEKLRNALSGAYFND
ncbi:MAG: sigma-70 family RNA polymerase sigma factor [Clostridia bacterium]